MNEPTEENLPEPGVPGPGLPVPGLPVNGDDSTPVAAPDGSGPPRALLAFVAVAVAILAIGLMVWLANRGGEDSVATIAPPTNSTTSSPTTSTIETTTTTTSSTSTSSTSTSSTSTSSTSTSSTSTTVAPTTTLPPFALPEPGATSWSVTSAYTPPMTLTLAATDGDVRVYDGVTEGLRCVGVVGPADALTTWCGEPGASAVFVADRGLEPLSVELGAEAGTATVARQAAGWTIASNGCSAPMPTILGAVAPGSRSVTSVICAGDEAFVGIGTALFGPEVAPDGGGILVAAGDEGWGPIGGFGTSIDCNGWPDGVDRCSLFRVEFELFEALLPIPPVAVLGEPSLDVTAVTDRTADIGSWIGDTIDPAAIEAIVIEELVDPDAEVPATTRRSDVLYFGRLQLLIVEIPQLDDSIRTETWAVWIATTESDATVTAFSWSTCGRGVTGDGLCV